MRRPFTKLATLAMMMGAMGASIPALSSNAPTATKDQISIKDQKPKVMKEVPRGDSWLSEGRRNPAGRFLNQKQYRKKCRQNPWMYKSKKHRSKN